VLNNFNMDGCPGFSGGRASLTGWTGTSSGCGGGAQPCSLNSNGFASGAPTPDPNGCAAFWDSNPAYSAISQTLDLQPGEVTGLFDFQAFWACRGSGSETCTLSLTIDDTFITLSEPTTRDGANPATYNEITSTGISINNPNAVVSIDCVATGGTICLLTQATLSTQGTVIGDPHFTGLDGQRFDATGKPGSSYNLISDSDLQVFSLFSFFVFFPPFSGICFDQDSPKCDPSSSLHLFR